MNNYENWLFFKRNIIDPILSIECDQEDNLAFTKQKSSFKSCKHILNVKNPSKNIYHYHDNGLAILQINMKYKCAIYIDYTDLSVTLRYENETGRKVFNQFNSIEKFAICFDKANKRTNGDYANMYIKMMDAVKRCE